MRQDGHTVGESPRAAGWQPWWFATISVAWSAPLSGCLDLFVAPAWSYGRQILWI